MSWRFQIEADTAIITTFQRTKKVPRRKNARSVQKSSTKSWGKRRWEEQDTESWIQNRSDNSSGFACDCKNVNSSGAMIDDVLTSSVFFEKILRFNVSLG